MRISFIIPYHNEPVIILQECIGSILRLSLTYEEREIVVVDDGSEYSPEYILKELSNDIVYIHQKNQGLSAARNNGLSHSTGDYIQFVDSDDALIPEVYERVINNVREKQMDILMFRFTHDKTKARLKNGKLSKCYKGCEYLLHENLRAAACCYIFRKNIIGNLRFYPGIYHEDALFTPQLIIRSSSLYVMKEEAYFYRQGDGTIMGNRNEKHIIKRLDDSVFVILELQRYSYGMEGGPSYAMQRCINQLTMCYIYTIIMLKRPLSELKQRIATLTNNNLYPLLLKHYTWKYWFFAILTKIF